MNLDLLRKERETWLNWKNIAPLREKLKILPEVDGKIILDNTISFLPTNLSSEEKKTVYDLAWQMKPWRKGPYDICKTFIDSEWQSFIKYNLLEPHFNLDGKIVGDIGCNNGYYLFRMLKQNPKKLVGFDPSALYKCQFDFVNHFLKTKIVYELLGVEHLPFYEFKFDTLFCLGVLYHRSDPISTLKALAKGLKEDGELFLDTFMIDGDEPFCLTPEKTYSKIPNIYFIPTIKALENWGNRAGFSKMELLATTTTNLNEQRKTKWIIGESLNDFLDKEDFNKTVEGYPAPKRAYVKFLR